MSRLLALVAVAVIAFLCAPRPVKVARDEPPVEAGYEEIVDFQLSMEDPELGLGDLGAAEAERQERDRLEEAISADPLGPPPAPEVEEYYKPEPTFPSYRPRRNPRWRFFRENGANDQSERSVALGLAWLAKQQMRDGNWEFNGSGKPDRVAATGLVLLTYIAVGQVRKPRDGEDTKYGKNVDAGLNFLLKQCPLGGPRAGRFENTSMTGQAVATLALCEAYAATRDPTLKPFAQAAVNYLQKAQDRDGGWRDTPDTVSDIATLGWVVQALDAARRTDELTVDDRVIKRASKFLDTLAAGPRKSMFGATHRSEAAPGTTSTAIGLFCRDRLDGWDSATPAIIDGVAGLMQNPPASNRDPLYLYYGTFVLWRYGSEEWKNWNEGPKDAEGARTGGVRDILVISQNRRNGPAGPSWDPAGAFGARYGRVGTTALNVLTLEVYYRDPAVYKGGK